MAKFQINITQLARNQARDLLDFIDVSPSPWHAVETAKQRLSADGFTELNESDAWQLAQGGSYFVTQGDASIISFRLGSKPLAETGFNMVGAHTDSPGLRLKPHAAFASDGLTRIGVEVYGGPILATFTDRDLSLAGRVTLRSNSKKCAYENRLSLFKESIVRLPNLAIHMNREVNDKGLKLNKQTELPLIFSMNIDGETAESQFLALVAENIKADPADILSWEFNVYDTQKGSFWGANQEFIANSQLDNLASCHAALTAMIQAKKPEATIICALFDHEEVGSESTTGASGSFLKDVANRITMQCKLSTEDAARAGAKSFFISADMAHAYHPNHPSAYEPCHHAHINQGVVIKTNSNQRYATNADSAARFMLLCESAGVAYQQYAHRTDLGCGSTIGPIIASGLGIATVDVGSPMWAMHSLRESAGVQDHSDMINVLSVFFGGN